VGRRRGPVGRRLALALLEDPFLLLVAHRLVEPRHVVPVPLLRRRVVRVRVRLAALLRVEPAELVGLLPGQTLPCRLRLQLLEPSSVHGPPPGLTIPAGAWSDARRMPVQYVIRLNRS